MARIVALYSSSPQQGKSTVADYLEAEHGYARLKFAQPLKLMLWSLLKHVNPSDDWVGRCLEGDLKNTPIKALGGKTPGQLMVSLGTDWGRAMVDPNIWCRIGQLQALARAKAGANTVIDDLRFPNEYQALMGLQRVSAVDVRLVKVEAIGAPVVERGGAEGLLDKYPWHYLLSAQWGHASALLEGVGPMLDHWDREAALL